MRWLRSVFDALKSDRIALATRPFLPITRPMSLLATCNSKIVDDPALRELTSTADGSFTRF